MKTINNNLDYLEIAKKVFSIEIDSIRTLSKMIDDNFNHAIDIIIKCRGRIILTGMGKSGIICKKIAATLTSTGTQSIFMHPSDAMHGDLGIITKKDVIIAVSNSGETAEIIQLIPHLKVLKNKIISITSNAGSTLAKESDVLLHYSIKREGCPLNLAPMASTTTVLALGDAIAATLMEAKNINEEDFYLFHPKGRLGQILLQVSDLMTKDDIPIVQRDTPMREVIKKMVATNFGAILIEGTKGHLRGIISDGDMKRLLEKDEDLIKKKASDVMNTKPKWIFEDTLAREALIKMENNRITILPVLSKNKKIAGLIHIHDIVKHNYGREK
ncbi:MAG: KpsF/GutQ family sugar-phosphate isomerase [Spirochaetota bacterium]|nr:KpsF/GutQ family sugar-phosphate isomerase [Spirochaetota bacterium]